MSDSQKINVSIEHRTDASMVSTAVLDVTHLTFAERAIASIAALGICWIVAALCVLVPVLHFFLVPAGLIAGVVGFFYKLRLHERRRAAAINCPACHEMVLLKAVSFNWPMLETCYACRSALRISPLSVRT